jgi:hypothetical protein
MLASGHLPGATASIHVRFHQRSRHPRVVKPDGYDEVAVMTIETVPSTGVAQLPDDEWFGEGSAFDSGEDLAAALFALAGVTHSDDPPEAEVTPPPLPVPQVESAFFEVERPAAVDSARRPYSSRGRTTAPSAPPRSWSVRAPGDALLPPTVSGRSGWTIRNSVAVLHRTEDAIAHLREDAVAMAFLAAAEACGRGRPPSLERRKHPR